jgi:nucleotide-binding universal stress UspA family protein
VNTSLGPVLVATDLTDDSSPALVRGYRHARAIGAALVVCHVVPDVLRHHPLLPGRHENDLAMASALTKRAAELVTDHVGRVLQISSDAYRVVVETGTAEDEIVRIAEAEQASLIALGAKLRQGMERWLGHVAERVVRYAHASVLVARPGHETGKILVPTDFGAGALPAIGVAHELVRSLQVRATLLHVLQLPSTTLASVMTPLGGVWVPPSKSAMDQLDALGKSTLGGLVEEHGFAGSEQVEGDPADVIVERAKALDVEMIIMGSRGRTGLRRLVLGSVAEKVIMRSHGSVLVAREPR